VAAIVFIVISMLRGTDVVTVSSGTREFFSDDDGKTFFVDDRAKLPPFDHNGKPAYRARVYTCDGGKTKFVGWLERYTPEAKKIVEGQVKAGAGSTGGGPILLEDQSGVQVKKAGTGEKGWVSNNDPANMRVKEVNCPNGLPAEQVLPP
jgi:hypothetical protein